MRGSPQSQQHLGLFAATGVGVGAVAGGGILALAGVAFAATGPSAILAFALNGGIALVTACSFAELAARFPQSGGAFAYARRVLAAEAAVAVGWVVWFASVVAAVLFAMGVAVFAAPFLEQIALLATGAAPEWIGRRLALVAYALCAVGACSWRLTRAPARGGRWGTAGKVVVLAALVAAGFLALAGEPPAPGALAARFRPFFADGLAGLALAMGYGFVALQGFDLIAAVGGEVRDPRRNVPRAMFLALGVALAIHLPLLFLMAAAGVPGRPVAEVAAEAPGVFAAVAARNLLGAAGYWTVMAAGLLFTLSALRAHLLAASRFARAMGADRTLPPRYARLAPGTGMPTAAIRLSALVIAFLLIAVPDLATAGALAGIVVLASFALTHAIGYVARRRAGAPDGFRTLWFPAVPVAGGAACLAIGLHQAVAVPSAGVFAALCLGVGAVLYGFHLAPRARVAGSAAQGRKTRTAKLRGRRPVVLAPIANPASAETLVTMAKALAPPEIARVQLLSVVEPPERYDPRELPRGVRDAQAVLGGALGAALAVDLRPEALITLNDDPWAEIARVAEATRCESLLLGVGHLDDSLMTGSLARLIGAVDSDVVILRAPGEWTPDGVRRILVPSRGGRDQSAVRARLLGSLGREARREVTFLGVLSEDAGAGGRRRARRDLQRLALDEMGDSARAELVVGEDIAAEVARRAADTDLLILGFHRSGPRRAVFSSLMLRIARATDCPLLMISHRRGAALMPETSPLLAEASRP